MATLNVPNAITIVRLALVPVTAYLLWRGAYGLALVLFASAALSDLVDGFIARTFNQSTALGAVLDPIADKLIVVVVTVLLAWQGLLPLWLAGAIILRDIIIVLGALAYRAAFGRVEMAPTRLSKANTAIEFVVLLVVMATAAEWIAAGASLELLFLLLLATVVGSGLQYVLVWGRKAAAGRPR